EVEIVGRKTRETRRAVGLELSAGLSTSSSWATDLPVGARLRFVTFGDAEAIYAASARSTHKRIALGLLAGCTELRETRRRRTTLVPDRTLLARGTVLRLEAAGGRNPQIELATPAEGCGPFDHVTACVQQERLIELRPQRGRRPPRPSLRSLLPGHGFGLTPPHHQELAAAARLAGEHQRPRPLGLDHQSPAHDPGIGRREVEREVVDDLLRITAGARAQVDSILLDRRER